MIVFIIFMGAKLCPSREGRNTDWIFRKSGPKWTIDFKT